MARINKYTWTVGQRVSYNGVPARVTRVTPKGFAEVNRKPGALFGQDGNERGGSGFMTRSVSIEPWTDEIEQQWLKTRAAKLAEVVAKMFDDSRTFTVDQIMTEVQKQSVGVLAQRAAAKAGKGK